MIIINKYKKVILYPLRTCDVPTALTSSCSRICLFLRVNKGTNGYKGRTKYVTFRGSYCNSGRVIFNPTLLPDKIQSLTADPFAPVDPRFPGRPGAPC